MFKIQLNTDKNISGDERLESYLSSVIEDELSLFSDDITRVEIHLADENSHKKGEDDKRCMLEARLKNRQPIAVTSHANSVEKAVNDALDKLKTSMETIYGRSKDHPNT
ncbi:HPF/RaiA family ribosome-associated protein [Arenibacter echinorum]|uniref:Sigma 54 modulation/S30EA-like ribosomal protein n=1 Tax=Arenibacter echinorum TaxID=440515 RepID=A0A327RGR8_9FLAO|nr:HPF/RaiA family ribosome-associated protein [Arenibacter echinorum]RAJ15355.1 sigma 54 modulation/S30EA-like ribosomal protein [Arenibacter echinorum]